MLGERSLPLGAWCSGITSASHAEGPGFDPQCVHFSNVNAEGDAPFPGLSVARRWVCFAKSCVYSWEITMGKELRPVHNRATTATMVGQKANPTASISDTFFSYKVDCSFELSSCMRLMLPGARHIELMHMPRPGIEPGTFRSSV